MRKKWYRSIICCFLTISFFKDWYDSESGYMPELKQEFNIKLKQFEMIDLCSFKNLVSISRVLLALFSFKALIRLNTSCGLDGDKKIEVFVHLEDVVEIMLLSREIEFAIDFPMLTKKLLNSSTIFSGSETVSPAAMVA